MRRPTRPRRPVRDERGSATVFVIGFSIVLFLCAGLVIDGGLAINQRMRIADRAEQTARVGANTIDLETFRSTDQVRLDQQQADQAMRAYLAGVGHRGGVSITWGDSVYGPVPQVELTDVSTTYILDLVGVTFPVRASAEAVPDTGPAPAPAP